MQNTIHHLEEDVFRRDARATGTLYGLMQLFHVTIGGPVVILDEAYFPNVEDLN